MNVLRPKGNLSKTDLVALAALAGIPLSIMGLRILALPGFDAAGWLRSIGGWLNEGLSLTGIAPSDREHVLYLLLLPVSTLLVSLVRLTLGIRVLGFRSILIAVGFHQCGILPSLLMITVAVVTVILVRPWLRRIRLPYYARVSVILCIVAMTMVGLLLASPWMQSNTLWRVIYFPVIVLGMLSEGIALTLDRNSIATAIWRSITTVLLAFLITGVCYIPALRDLMLQFPELVVTQIVAIVLVSEFLDLRLLENWDTRVSQFAQRRLRMRRKRFRVAVVRNRAETQSAVRLGEPPPQPQRQVRHSVQKIVDALRADRHSVKVLEGDKSLLKEIQLFMPPDPLTGEPSGLVFNLALGVQGHARTTQVPALLEMSGIAYTGPTPRGHAILLDRVATKALLQQADVLTPAYRTLGGSKFADGMLPYPLIVKPRYESTYRLRAVHDRRELKDSIRSVARRSGPDVIVEQFVTGTEIHACLLGNDPVECLPLVERDRQTGEKICPARIDEILAARIRDIALTAYGVSGCRDYARIDFIVTETGQAYVIEVLVHSILDTGGSFATAAQHAGYPFAKLPSRIVAVARTRHAPHRRIRPLKAKRSAEIGAGEEASQ